MQNVVYSLLIRFCFFRLLRLWRGFGHYCKPPLQVTYICFELLYFVQELLDQAVYVCIKRDCCNNIALFNADSENFLTLNICHVIIRHIAKQKANNLSKNNETLNKFYFDFKKGGKKQYPYYYLSMAILIDR